MYKVKSFTLSNPSDYSLPDWIRTIGA